MKRAPTTAERAHMARIAAMPCICCTLLGRRQESKTDVHHPRFAAGAGERSPHWLAIPLCHEDCHQGRNGIHGERTYLAILKLDEPDLLAATIERLMKGAA